MRLFITSAILLAAMTADAQILTPDIQGQPRDSRDSYQRDDPYYDRDDPYYENDRNSRRDRRRNRRERTRDTYGYEGRNGSGYGTDPVGIANRVLSDVRGVASNNYRIEKDDRKHFEEVEEELNKFTRKYRDGKFDKNNLKDAAESLQHLARSNRIQSSRDRRVLEDSLRAVEDLRSGRYGTR